jgi:hypothetical protein
MKYTDKCQFNVKTAVGTRQSFTTCRCSANIRVKVHEEIYTRIRDNRVISTDKTEYKSGTKCGDNWFRDECTELRLFKSAEIKHNF